MIKTTCIVTKILTIKPNLDEEEKRLDEEEKRLEEKKRKEKRRSELQKEFKKENKENQEEIILNLRKEEIKNIEQLIEVSNANLNELNIASKNYTAIIKEKTKVEKNKKDIEDLIKKQAELQKSINYYKQNIEGYNNTISLIKAKITEAEKTKGGAIYDIKCSKARSSCSNVIDKYMKYLNKKTVVKLKNIAKNKNIKITTKKEGKIVYLKKSAIIKKICDFTHHKKAPNPKKVAKKALKK